jgi:UDPglucose 6-dehydrogenase
MSFISIIGLGFVGSAMKRSFEEKGCCVLGYDKYKDNIDSFEMCLKTDIMFLALPTIYDETKHEYDKSCIIEVCTNLTNHNYNGLVVIKSTVEPTTTFELHKLFPQLKFVHNPEFLSASTAYEDFHNQTHIVLGKGPNVSDNDLITLQNFYKQLYPTADISICNSLESESMKIFVNCFYSVKIQFFNELYLLCEKNNCDYNKVKDLMIKNNWINPMHTQVPGIDGQLSYGGLCFPKDTNALLQFMKRCGTPSKVLDATIEERNIMRTDNLNVKKIT